MFVAVTFASSAGYRVTAGWLGRLQKATAQVTPRNADSIQEKSEVAN
jgi:hypothetical protein